MTHTDKTQIRDYLNEERQQQSSPFITGNHNFKIDMTLFMHNIANCVNNSSQYSIIYKMMKDITMYNTVVISNPMIKKITKTTSKVYYAFIKRLEATNLLKKIDYSGKRGEVKYMINPYIMYNHRKCKSNRQYQENCSVWNIL